VERLPFLGEEGDRAGAVPALVGFADEDGPILVHVILTCDGVTRHPPSSAHLRPSDCQHSLGDLRRRRRRRQQEQSQSQGEARVLHGCQPPEGGCGPRRLQAEARAPARRARWYFSSSALALTIVASLSVTAARYLPGKT